EREDLHRRLLATLADECELASGLTPGHAAVKGGIAGDVLGLHSRPKALRRGDVKLAGERAVLPSVDDPFGVRRPLVVEDLDVIDDDLLIASVGFHRP